MAWLGTLGLVVLLGLVGGGVLWFRRSAVVFEIGVRDGRAEVVQGEAPDEYVTDVQRICDLWGIRAGRIRAVKRRKKRALYGRAREVGIVCSGEQVRKHERAFRNAWRHPM